MINARVHAHTRDRKELPRDGGSHLLEWSETDGPEEMMLELDFEESVVFFHGKELGCSTQGRGGNTCGVQRRSNSRLMKYKGRVTEISHDVVGGDTGWSSYDMRTQGHLFTDLPKTSQTIPLSLLKFP